MANNGCKILILLILSLAVVAETLAEPEPKTATDEANTSTSEPPHVLLSLQSLVQKELDLLDENVSLAAESLAATGLEGPEARRVLNAVCQVNPHLIDCSIVDLNGIMVTVEPDSDRGSEGSNIRDQVRV